jgi:hypothetical protein
MARSHRHAVPFLSLLTFGFLLAIIVFLGVALRDEIQKAPRPAPVPPPEPAAVATATPLRPPEPAKPAPPDVPVPTHRARVRGTVLAGGAPVASASVLALWSTRVEASTDPGGRFELVLDPGRALILARGPGGHATGTVLDLAEGKDERVELALTRPLGITGTVHDLSGAPLGARIDLTGPDVHRVANSEPDGSYSFADLSPGTYSLTAWVGGLAKKRVEAILLEDAPVRLADLALGPGGSVRGVVRDATRSLLANATVWAIKSRECVAEGHTGPAGELLMEDLPAGPLELVAWSDLPPHASARVRVDVPTGGEARVELRLHPRESLAGQVRFADGRRPSNGKVVARSAETGRSSSASLLHGDFLLDPVEAPLTFTVETAEGAFPFLDLPWSEPDEKDRGRPRVIDLPQTGAVQGTLRDDVGEPVIVGRAGIYQKGSKASRDGFVGTDGSFSVAAQPPGDYTLVARGWDNTAQLWDGRFFEAAVLVHPGETVNLAPTLARAARVEGVLVDRTGEPLPGIDLSVSLGSGIQRFELRTEDGGAFTTFLSPAVATFSLSRGAIELAEKKAAHGLVFAPVRLQVPAARPIVLVADWTD